MYKIKSEKRRIDWLYKKYCNTNKFSLNEFIELINEYYYKHSFKLYKNRNTEDIQYQYSKLFKDLKLNQKENFNIINIGAGQGFDYFQFLKFKIDFDKFYFIEPNENMIKNFKNNNLNLDKRVIIINDFYSDKLKNETYRIKNKIILMNSCLHHFVEIDQILNLIKSSMKKGDYFILCHEPHNIYHKSFLSYLTLIIKLFTSNYILTKFGLTNRKQDLNKKRWKKINSDLINKKIIKSILKPIIIRRIIDYGINTKNDWKYLKIPTDYDEGHWQPQTLIDFFGKNFGVEFINSYRHFGDDNGNYFIKKLNLFLDKILNSSKKGSVFSIVLKKLY